MQKILDTATPLPVFAAFINASRPYTYRRTRPTPVVRPALSVWDIANHNGRQRLLRFLQQEWSLLYRTGDVTAIRNWMAKVGRHIENARQLAEAHPTNVKLKRAVRLFTILSGNACRVVEGLRRSRRSSKTAPHIIVEDVSSPAGARWWKKKVRDTEAITAYLETHFDAVEAQAIVAELTPPRRKVSIQAVGLTLLEHLDRIAARLASRSRYIPQPQAKGSQLSRDDVLALFDHPELIESGDFEDGSPILRKPPEPAPVPSQSAQAMCGRQSDMTGFIVVNVYATRKQRGRPGRNPNDPMKPKVTVPTAASVLAEIRAG